MKLNLFEVQSITIIDDDIGDTRLKTITVKTNSLKGLETFVINCFLEHPKPEPINGTPVLTTTHTTQAQA